jgi:hypothetical protein
MKAAFRLRSALLFLICTVFLGAAPVEAQVKISELPALGGAPAALDLIPMVDVSANTTKSMTVGNLLGGTLGTAAYTAASDYQPLDLDLTALAALTGTNTIYYRSSPNTWTAVTLGTGLDFTGGTLSASGAGLGDFSSNTASSIDSELVLFSGTGGKTGKRASQTGRPLLTAGVLSVGNINAASEVTGTLPVGNGGTGATSLVDLLTLGNAHDRELRGHGRGDFQ